jgi:hypothetical protein
MEVNVAAKTLLVIFVLWILGPGAAWAQNTIPEGARVKIQCDAEPYVTVTADAEQAIPLDIMEKAACGEKALVISDTDGYTVQVRTEMGNVGYVTRHEIAIDSSASRSTAAVAAGARDSADHAAHATAGQGSARQPGTSSKPHVYVSDSASWTASGGFGNPSSVAPGDLYGGYNPEMVDVYQDFTSDCSGIVVTQEKSKADFAVLFDKGAAKKGITGLGGLVKVNKVTVLSRSGGTLLSDSAHSPETAVRMACAALTEPRTPSTSKTDKQPR